MKWFPRFLARLPALLAVAVSISTAVGQDPSIDQLLKKLPPPETLVKPSVDRAVHQHDPALRDPLIPQIVSAARAANIQRTLELTRKFVERHPESPGAHNLQGVIYFALHNYAKAAAEFRKAITLQPTFTAAQFNLGVTEYLQGHFAAAMPPFRRAMDLEPNAQLLGWYTLSVARTKLVVSRSPSTTRSVRQQKARPSLRCGFNSRGPRMRWDTRQKRWRP